MGRRELAPWAVLTLFTLTLAGSCVIAGRSLRQVDVDEELAGEKEYDYLELPKKYGADARVNISDGSIDNKVYQVFQFYAALPPAPPPPPYPGYAPRPPLDPRDHNPTCGDPGAKNFAYSLTDKQIDSRADDGGKFAVYVAPTHEVQAVLLVWLGRGVKDGYASVRGPGLLADVKVDRANFMHTVCGDWSYSSSGFYTYEFRELDDVRARLLYFVRRYNKAEEAVWLEHPVNIQMDMNNNLEVDNADLEVTVEMQADWAKRVIYIDVENVVTDRETLDTALAEFIQEDANIVDEETSLYLSPPANEQSQAGIRNSNADSAASARAGGFVLPSSKALADAATIRASATDDDEEYDYVDYEDYFELAYEEDLSGRFRDTVGV